METRTQNIESSICSVAFRIFWIIMVMVPTETRISTTRSIIVIIASLLLFSLFPVSGSRRTPAHQPVRQMPIGLSHAIAHIFKATLYHQLRDL